jgi:hypothetical protein
VPPDSVVELMNLLGPVRVLLVELNEFVTVSFVILALPISDILDPETDTVPCVPTPDGVPAIILIEPPEVGLIPDVNVIEPPTLPLVGVFDPEIINEFAEPDVTSGLFMY